MDDGALLVEVQLDVRFLVSRNLYYRHSDYRHLNGKKVGLLIGSAPFGQKNIGPTANWLKYIDMSGIWSAEICFVGILMTGI